MSEDPFVIAASGETGDTPYERRQVRLWNFVEHHHVRACFRCNNESPDAWAKTGISEFGPWAICAACIQNRDRIEEEDLDGPFAAMAAEHRAICEGS